MLSSVLPSLSNSLALCLSRSLSASIEDNSRCWLLMISNIVNASSNENSLLKVKTSHLPEMKASNHQTKIQLKLTMWFRCCLQYLLFTLSYSSPFLVFIVVFFPSLLKVACSIIDWSQGKQFFFFRGVNFFYHQISPFCFLFMIQASICLADPAERLTCEQKAYLPFRELQND